MPEHAIVLVDTRGIIRHWDRGAERFFGYAAAEAIGQSLDLIVPDEFRQRHWDGFRHAMASGESRLQGAAHPGLPVRCKDGRVGAFPGRLNLLLSPGGAAIGAIAIYQAGAGN